MHLAHHYDRRLQGCQTDKSNSIKYKDEEVEKGLSDLAKVLIPIHAINTAKKSPMKIQLPPKVAT